MDTGRLEEAIREHGLEAHREAILATARPAVYLRLGEAGQGDVGQSRMGGIPDLPDSLPWPVDPLLGRLRSFLVQINLAQVPDFADNPLPRNGMLYVFADENEDRADQLIVHTGDEPLRPRPPAPDAQFVTDWYDDLVPHRLTLVLGADVPRWATDDYQALIEAVGDDDFALDDLAGTLSGGQGRAGKLLGHASGIGHDPREDAYVVREVNAEWLYNYEQRGTLDMSGAARWTNLLEVESVQAVNLLIGDAGYLQVLAHEDDLRRHDFSRVYVSMESS